MVTTRRHGRIRTSVAAALLLASSQLLAQEAKAAIIKFDIESQPLAQALNTWADQAGLQVIWPAGDPVAYQSSPIVHGSLEPMQALRVLLEDTGLTYSVLGGGQTVAIHGRDTPTAASPGVGDPLRVADVKAGASGDGAEAAGPSGQSMGRSMAIEPQRDHLEVVIVTGSHIRGAADSPAPIHSYDRSAMDRSGVGTVGDFMKRIPQNFNGGPSEDSVGGQAGGEPHEVSGASVNLRGLGSDSTLTLINGRRVAPADQRGGFADISLIPLNAIERIDVLTDGSSAVYGSDAVGGVVNFVLRRDFTGPETRVRYGSVTEGSSHELQVGQTVGTNWQRGSALLSYEYYDRTPLDGRDRGMQTPAANYLLPQQKRHGALLTAHHSTDSGLELFSDATYAHRSVEQVYSGVDIPTEAHASDIDSWTLTMGGRQPLSNSVGLEISSSYARSRTHSDGFFVDFDVPSLDRKTDTDVASVDAKLDGSLFSTSRGDVQFALGAQYRREGYERVNLLDPGNNYDADRGVVASFAEFRIPLLASAAGSTSSLLELVLADRYERYNDFGSSNNPMAGAIWRPLPGLRIRGTYGTSFRAPLLSELDNRRTQTIAENVPSPSLGSTDVVLLVGGNPALSPQDATTWTVGFDLDTDNVPGLRVAGTYYNIRYDDRIVRPGDSIQDSEALSNADVLGAEIVQQGPALSLVEELAADPTFVDFRCFGGDNCGSLDTITAVLDYRLRNLSRVETSGVDLGITYARELPFAQMEVGVEGTYILKFDSQFTARSPVSEGLNIPYNPVDLKLRGHLAATHEDLTLALFLNYVDSYTDNRTFIAGTPSPIPSWTTIDATLGYSLSPGRGMWGGFSATLGIINLTDKDPPLVRNRFYGVDFDGTNANALGRFVSLQLSKHW